MSRQFAVSFSAVCLALISSVTAGAQERLAVSPVDFRMATAIVDPVRSGPLPAVAFAPIPARPRGVSLMPAFYVMTATMQALDVHSTLSAFSHGAVEANPLMRGITGNRAAFIAMKAGVATTTILATRGMARRHKVGAIATLIAVNAGYAWVINHNYQVARGR